MKENEKRKRNRARAPSASRRQRTYFCGRSPHGFAKGFEVYFHVDDRGCSVTKADNDGLPQLHRNGQRHLRSASAARYKFHTTAAKLTARQCALIAATLPNPIRFDSAHPSSYILKRQGQILRLMKLVPKFPPGRADGLKIIKNASRW